MKTCTNPKRQVSPVALKEAKLVRMYERTGLNTTNIAFTKAQRIQLNIAYAKLFGSK